MLLMLEGCSSGYAPVSDRSSVLNNKVELVRSARHQARSKDVPTTYRVKRGDTLYSIAWRYRLDYRALARSNNIDNSFRINVDQILQLKNINAGTSLASESNSNTLMTKPTVSQKTTNKNQVVQQVPKSAPVKEALSLQRNSKDLIWRWPVQGKVISYYSNKGEVNKGINLEGKRGEPVYAAAAGKVVYAGSGLLGYGNLIIINHNQEYLSAYAHNSRIFVKESEFVNVGAKVAEIGNSGATRTMLHFEIRKDGKPVNPLQYLPKR